MKVLLLEDVENLGLAGDVATVKSGYGRNYLIPQELAMLATSGALKQAEGIRKAGELRRAREKSDAEAIVNQIEGKTLVFYRRAGDRNRLYGSVTGTDIAKELSEQSGIEIDKRKIKLAEPIRNLGEFDVTIRLMVEVAVDIKVFVIREGQTLEEARAEQVKVAEAEAAEAEAEAAALEAAAIEEAEAIVSEAADEVEAAAEDASVEAEAEAETAEAETAEEDEDE